MKETEKLLLDFIESITLANVPFAYLDGTPIVAAAYKTLQKHNDMRDKNRAEIRAS